jgi:hypothetical protein
MHVNKVLRPVARPLSRRLVSCGVALQIRTSMTTTLQHEEIQARLRATVASEGWDAAWFIMSLLRSPVLGQLTISACHYTGRTA